MPSAPTITVVSTAPHGAGDDVVALVDRARAASARQPVDEHRWRRARQGKDPEQRVVLAHRDGGLVGLVLITRGDDEWTLDQVIDLAVRDDDAVIAPLVADAVGTVAGRGGGLAQLWVHEAGDTDEQAATAGGLTQRRDLHQLRVPLPLGIDDTPTVATRPFVVGQDEEAWLAVNAAAFADHPDQGRWTIDDLRSREAEPWFDPSGFLLNEVGDGDERRLAGFNWTKVHGSSSGARGQERLGEIYVIGVHPDFAGRGLGRALCIAGLDLLAQRASTGMLYVDASNTPAMRLYLGLGFTIDHTNTAFAGLIAPNS